MPKQIIMRRLPGNSDKLFDETQLPEGHIVFNPSMAYPYIYLRANKQNETDEENYILLYNCLTNTSTVIGNLENILEKNVNRYRGLEDLRLCNFEDKLWFVATCTHASKSMNSELVVGYFNDTKTAIERISYVYLGKPPVKNVCPFVYNSKLCLFDIYKQTIYEIGNVKNEKQQWQAFKAIKIGDITCGKNLDIENFRGSTSLVHLHGNLYGCVVHDVIFTENAHHKTQLAYMHYWLEIDMNLKQVTNISTPFWLVTFGVEFVSGICMKDNVIELYFGVQDKLAFKHTTTLALLRNGT